MISKINVADVIFRHLSTLRNERTKKIDRLDIVLFYAVPAIGSVVFFCLKVSIKYDAIAIFVTSFSIFTGFLINILIFMHGMTNSSTQTPKDKDKAWLFESAFYNISYAILVSIMTIILLILMAFMEHASTVYEISSFIFIFLLANFLLTLVMILKRVHVIFVLNRQQA